MKYLGIDIGSVMISIALVDENKQILRTSYLPHEGKISERLTNELRKYPLNEIKGIAVTNSAPKIFKHHKTYDTRVSFINAVRHYFDKIGSILIVGGEKFGLVIFDEQGNYVKYKGNTSCAAGTGSFLDQQAKRMNIPTIMEFSELALKNEGDFPKIASRCAVFAKTDIIHAQQEGYTKQEIADGLSYGLAKNLVDTLFSGTNYLEPVIFVGGVSLNKAVIKHINRLLGTEIVTHEYGYLFGAIGAAFNLIDDLSEHSEEFPQIQAPEDFMILEEQKRTYYYPPLELKLSDYPDFSSLRKYEYQSKQYPQTTPVETDIYEEIKQGEINVYLGIDIGSTSTKATVIDENKNVLIGLYTRTSGQPVIAVQTIFETLTDIEKQYGVKFNFLGVGTTGSGRKFIGKIIGADSMLDEITAHARAAYELDPEVDTIIEIGGQDSKFTTLRNGMVTFSVMNNVCAAGTGSFIEEQAKKLGVPLSEYADRAMGVPAPLASDRCTVFMERDLNHYINKGYSTNEILAAVLHSIRENYITKVAIESSIGKKIFFQGATAKNKALVAAFEQRLKRPIMVSKFCHLTGALGVALELHDKKITKSKFRGLQIYKQHIPVKTEICDLCPNHCKLKVAEINGEVEAYGFLCGRDYNVQKFVNYNTSGFDLIREYRRTFIYRPRSKSDKIVGIPYNFYLMEEMPLWRKFFDLLGIKTVTSEKVEDPIKKGKNLSTAEFCAPMAAMHAHIDYLKDKADFIFLPTYLEEKTGDKRIRRMYCYYTQFVPAIITSNLNFKNLKFITPLLRSLANEYRAVYELYKALKKAGFDVTLYKVNNAYNQAKKFYNSLKIKWKKVFEKYSAKKDDKIKVVFLGRPYTILMPQMNSNIPDIFAKNGIKTFYYDMIDVSDEDVKEIKYLLEVMKWKYASKILAVAEKVAKMDGYYPVYITSFKCSPDSFALEYFKMIMEKHKKPYLILQLDEHDSSVGYETRIEAAIRSFTNHYQLSKKEYEEPLKCDNTNVFTSPKELGHRTLLLPEWDPYISPLLRGTLKNAGFNAISLSDTPTSILKSTVLNTGQCIPLSIIIQNTIDLIVNNKLNPEDYAVWLVQNNLACNFSMYPYYLRKVLRDKKYAYPNLDKVGVYLGELSFLEFGFNTGVNAYLSYMFGGYIRKMGNKIRPYEINKGQTNAVIKQSLEYLEFVFAEGLDKEKALAKIIKDFKEIPVRKDETRPKVAIFGDLYIRDNDTLNQHIIEFMEEHGAEVITTPYSEYLKIIINPYFRRRFREGFIFDAATIRFVDMLIPMVEQKYYPYFQEILKEPLPKPIENLEEKLREYNINILHFGESFDNALKVLHITENHPDLAFFVQLNPAYCAAALITASMAEKIQELTGKPVVTIEYDATSEFKNDQVVPFLQFAKEKIKKQLQLYV